MRILPMAPDGLAGACCSLEAAEVRLRLAAWRRLRDRAAVIARRDDGVEMEFGPDVGIEEITRLAELESACCPFYRFTVEPGPAGSRLSIHAGPGNGEAVAALLGLG
jgi:hypothetical protein